MELERDSQSPPAISEDSGTSRIKSDDSGAHLEALEQESVPYATWNESRTGPNGIPTISDDVNALSMSVGRQSSYLGVSSVAAALRVISKINQDLEAVMLGDPLQTAHSSGFNSPRRTEAVEESPEAISSPVLSEGQMVDAYFYHVHPLIPMIDETRFRVRFSAGERRDASWLALLYMVFALGTIAGSNAEDNSHLLHYDKAKACIDLDMFGNGQIEGVQALGLMGGLYLHYESRPNMANALMGAAMRMACALGLHREYLDGPSESRPDFVRRAMLIPRETRRRTWWSLFCMDTWATTTQGRPSFGRISPAITVLPPSYLGDRPDMSRPGSMGDDDAFVTILNYEVSFCKIATRIQDRLAETPLLSPEETKRFDLELHHWRNSLPPMFHASASCPRRAVTPRAVMCWRFHNLRLVLYRPLLLNNALRSSLDQNDGASEDEVRSVANCRRIAADSIQDIGAQWKETQISGWNAVWLLFQASMVPIVTLFAEFNRGNLHEVREAQAKIEQVIALLGQMAQWSVTARKTRNFIIKIYSHSRSMLDLVGTSPSPRPRPNTSTSAISMPPTTTTTTHTPHMHSSSLPSSLPPQLSIDTQLVQSSAPTSAIRFSGGAMEHPHGLWATTNTPASLSASMSSSAPAASPMIGHSHSNSAASIGVLAPGMGGAQPSALDARGPMTMTTTSSGESVLALTHHHHHHHDGDDHQQHQHQHQHAMAEAAKMHHHHGPHATFMTQDELNAFWQQVMWGEGEMPEFMMDTSFDY
ncbi:MAG: hypothetical protein LQ340_002772, partial [Diploschistes diacapsis]